ncbi:MAG: hypothetical protein M3126_05575 [Candidatus Eremiobacteraeota bacterium]|nr:hypothetical protein [Candidatus Eremiobacteraeota bacterium]
MHYTRFNLKLPARAGPAGAARKERRDAEEQTAFRRILCPSLPAVDRLPNDGITYLPPVTRGDVERAVETSDALLMIDGVFHHDLAPSPKEVYAAETELTPQERKLQPS